MSLSARPAPLAPGPVERQAAGHLAGVPAPAVDLAAAAAQEADLMIAIERWQAHQRSAMTRAEAAAARDRAENDDAADSAWGALATVASRVRHLALAGLTDLPTVAGRPEAWILTSAGEPGEAAQVVVLQGDGTLCVGHLRRNHWRGVRLALWAEAPALGRGVARAGVLALGLVTLCRILPWSDRLSPLRVTTLLWSVVGLVLLVPLGLGLLGAVWTRVLAPLLRTLLTGLGDAPHTLGDLRPLAARDLVAHPDLHEDLQGVLARTEQRGVERLRTHTLDLPHAALAALAAGSALWVQMPEPEVLPYPPIPPELPPSRPW